MNGEQENELFDTLHFIKDRMVTKEELRNGLDGLRTELKADIGRLEDKVDHFMDAEVDRRKQLEVRVSKIETKVFAK